MLYVIPDTLLKVWLNTNKTGHRVIPDTLLSVVNTKVERSNPVYGEVYLIQQCDKICQLLATGLWFSPPGELDKTVTCCQIYTLVSSTNKTVRQKVKLIKQLLVVRCIL
jgi:hypothetical protein